METIVMELDNVGKLFGPRRIFRGISGRAGQGEIVTVQGPNGSGKSTLLSILCGLQQPTEGKARFVYKGAEASRWELQSIVGWVAPALSLYQELTGMENLGFLSRVRGMNMEERELEALLDRVGLEGRGKDLVGSYSTGMKVRLKYAQAILHSPPVLILDEPFSNLDPDGVERVEQIIEDWRKKGMVVMAHPGRESRLHGDWSIQLGS